MAFKIIDGSRGEAHVSPLEVADTNMSIFGPDSYVMPVGRRFAHELSTGKIEIFDGQLIHQGIRGGIPPLTSVELAVENGSVGATRNDLVVARYTKNLETSIDDMQLVIIKGTNNQGDPNYNRGIIRDGAIISDFPIKRIKFEGINMSAEDMYAPKSLLELISGDKGISTERLADKSITNTKLADQAVTYDKVSRQLIQRGKVTVGNGTLTGGYIYYLAWITFPVAFTTVPNVIANIDSGISDSHAFSTTFYGIEKTRARVRIEARATSGAVAVNIPLYWTAIGG